MKVKSYRGATSFLQDNQVFLEREEAVNSLMLGLAQRAVEQEAVGQPSLALGCWRVQTDEEAPVLFILLSSKNAVVASGDAAVTGEALDHAVKVLLQSGREIPGFVGPRPLTDQLAEQWKERTGQQLSLAMNQRIYELETVNPQPGAGTLVKVGQTQLPLAAKWTYDFASKIDETTQKEAEEIVQRSYEEGELYFWEVGGVPVSMAKAARPTANSITISLVYTPPERRNKGYASSCVAALSQKMLDLGYTYCVLYTDLANPTSNHIYQNIGYKAVCDSVHYRSGI
ncbi:GNAT family N-acetyltransferase [Bacillaceae bacterium SIJ1]|uniref:GNAT family N-acetyltransferase n=1 Tax=Litoribacterium kuwaitense TaxID=1398745 RepID=UPI0013EB1D14|nr:GNAT family N-acetyltransferase [Litoribacterium kuwaitense]NGP44641.1 GNAT family N-acetyltransferase [Litoribacterium kuwaitense]